MSQTIPSNPTSIPDRLPDSVYLHIVDTLRGHLPDPPINDPEHRARQLESAIAEVGSFAPANAAEANLAARYVAFSAHADDCLRLAVLKAAKGELDWVLRCRTQANASARQASGQLNLLLRLQNQRRKLENDPQALNRAAWAEHCAIGRMADALADRPPPESIAESPPPPPAPEATAQPPAPAAPELEPESGPLSEAQLYATFYPERAALIRRVGRVPDDITFAPPDDDLVQALLACQDPVLAMIDRQFADCEVY
jgi:hypothetical protein